MKKQSFFVLCVAVCALLAFALAGCAAPGGSAPQESTEISNPFVPCETLADAAKRTGFEFSVPEKIGTQEISSIEEADGTLIQVSYGTAESRILVRKALGSDDISGDYNTYDTTETRTIADRAVTTKGNGGAVSVATWQQDGYTYAIDFDTPTDADSLEALIAAVQ